MTFQAHPARYDVMPDRFCGKSGLKLPAISLGLWHNFGDATPLVTQSELLRTAFDLSITHFDLAWALNHLPFSADELQAIDQHAVEGGINLWQKPSTDQRP